MIFVIDDDSPVRDSLRVLLEIAGHAVEDFPSAETFLASSVFTERDCLIVADIHLAGMSGIQLLEKLRGDGNPIPVILITGRLAAAITTRAEAAGVLAILQKPVDTALILKLVENAARA
jgi:two-component system, LuxR family, response regulator FixJ